MAPFVTRTLEPGISSNVAGVRETVTLSWEPLDGSISPNLLDGGTPLVTKLDADDQSQESNLKSGGKSALTEVFVLGNNDIHPANGMTTLRLAKNLLTSYFRYNNHNGNEGYFGVPMAGDQHNSNSGTYTLLRMAGFSPEYLANINVDTDKGYSETLTGDFFIPPVIGPGGVLIIPPVVHIGTAPGWEQTLRPDDFRGPGFNFHAVATATGMLTTSFVTNLILRNPKLADAFHGALGELTALVNGVESIADGGVFNVATGALDLDLLAAKLLRDGRVPISSLSAAGQQEFQNWLSAYGLQTIASIQGIVNGFEQGGVWGGVNSGMDANELVVALEHLFANPAFAASGEGITIAIAVGVVVGLATLIFGGHHDNPASMPDKYDTARFTQYVGELQGSAGTAYAPPYNQAADPVQEGLGGLPELLYIQDWVRNNLNSSNDEIRREAEKLQPLYGTTGGGKLNFDHDIANEEVIGGTEAGTYLSIYNDAGTAVGEITLLDSAFPKTAVLPPSAKALETDYGGLAWVPFFLPDGNTGYWAPKGDGTYYYFGPDTVLYHDNYPGEVQPQDVSPNAVGYAPTYDFAAAMSAQQQAGYYDGGADAGAGTYYGGIKYE